MKKCLLIAPLFNNYYKDIIVQLNHLGYEVTFSRDQVSDSTFTFVLKRISKKYIRKKTTSYVKKNILIHENKFDLVIVILAYSFSEYDIKIIKEHFNNARFVYYTWDSVSNFPIIKTFFKYFDKVFSFDKKDCVLYGLDFLPLFYIKKVSKKVIKYDYALIMSLYPSKVISYLNVIRDIPEKLNGFVYVVVKSKLFFLYYKIRYLKTFKSITRKEVRFKPLKRDNVYKVFENSNVVIDLPLKNQNGLTIRTFESLALGCKLITTNINIKDYDFYDEEKIIILDKNITLSKAFFKTICENVFDDKGKYSIENFVKELLL